MDIHVIRLSGIRIVAPLNRVRQNTEMPIYLMGLDDYEIPFAFGTCNPPLIVEWTLSDHQSGQVSSPFIHSGLNPLSSGSYFAVRFKALQPGHTTLKVKVSSHPHAGQLAHAELKDEISIQVYESLQLINPYSTTGDVLVMMLNTELNLRTNLESSASVEYVVEGSNEIIRPDGKGNIRSGASLGQASLITTATNTYGVAQSISTLVEVDKINPFPMKLKTIFATCVGSPCFLHYVDGIPSSGINARNSSISNSSWFRFGASVKLSRCPWTNFSWNPESASLSAQSV